MSDNMSNFDSAFNPEVAPIICDAHPAMSAELESPTINNDFRSSVSEMWKSIRGDYHEGGAKEKTLLLSALAFQAWNGFQMQRVVSIPAALAIYKTTGDELLAGAAFAGLNYTQQLGISGTLGAAARQFPQSLETFTEEFPGIQSRVKSLNDKVQGPVSSRVHHGLVGQSLGASPYVLGEVIANPKGDTKGTVLLAEKASRRIGIVSGAIGVGVLKLVEEYPENDTVQRIAGHAQNPWVWAALGIIPTTIAGGFKLAMNKIRRK